MHIDAARHLVTRHLLPRWPDAKVAIIGGSIARGEATPTSDIDLLLVFDRVDHAWRDTFKVGAQTVELFGHDPATFDYFCRTVDRPAGRMPLVEMVLDGVSLLPDTGAAAWLRTHARELFDLGPPAPTPAMLAGHRYAITTLLEDLIDGTAPDETLATAVKLYDTLALFALRAAGAWTGDGKHLARRLRAVDPALATDLVAAMAALAADPAAGKALFDTAARRTLAPHGGLLLEGYTAPAPAGWRSEGIVFPLAT
ncbi:nucleotidyltransferase domain-containing protein [Pseudoduganella lutea]|uniref:Polymerase nucleotidyl transferase domain-containing protein n=1 Tax=Pseudoduganella lutea TaxID=321985 RepID=A0A4V0Z3S4_9BURK|nr:nucleotidyltransferase domain-containing protein [Pseudoduganella lutea]QBE64453.1 hypothetical protein EWM63_16880 [Pseudoduganella lutea]